ncbi:MAG: c-type cytochrome [Xanthomonadaceae bacterium]|nr:c-type cytochrome [Xanthomonadaceae bacterium]MDE1963744.1 c-type cytochrome [Xanthomonadaceae bacterium]
MRIDRWRGCVVAVAALLIGSALPAMAQDAATIAAQGNGKGAAPCQTCHAPDGSGQASGGFPRLAGQNAAYLQSQLDAFAAGTRENAVMQPQSAALTEAERQALARYFSAMPAVATPGAAGTAPYADPEHLGQMLATRGRWSKQVPACEQCHGPGGVGVGAGFPPLAGQSANYLAAQLKAFRSGTRHNDPMGLMRHIAQALDDRDIDAVAHWFAAQPFPPKESRP